MDCEDAVIAGFRKEFEQMGSLRRVGPFFCPLLDRIRGPEEAYGMSPGLYRVAIVQGATDAALAQESAGRFPDCASDRNRCRQCPRMAIAPKVRTSRQWTECLTGELPRDDAEPQSGVLPRF
jgi:hypothetical protein